MMNVVIKEHQTDQDKPEKLYYSLSTPIFGKKGKEKLVENKESNVIPTTTNVSDYGQ